MKCPVNKSERGSSSPRVAEVYNQIAAAAENVNYVVRGAKDDNVKKKIEV